MITLGNLDYLEGKRILITGGTGSLGKKLTRIMLDNCKDITIAVFSRDEFKQYEMSETMSASDLKRMRFFLGDVRDRDRLNRALNGVDYVIHAAALKQVPAAEYNPFEFIQTNVIGAQNLISACIDQGVKRVVALSTDKAANPINLYGATKLCSDKLFTSASAYTGTALTRFSVVRYGNVVGSRGSVIPFFLKKKSDGILPITDPRMTRFWITLDQGAYLVLNAMQDMQGGEVFIPKLPSMNIVDLANAIAPDCKHEIVGIRPGEKIHEEMIPAEMSADAMEFKTHFVLVPRRDWEQVEYYKSIGGKFREHGQAYSSGDNGWMLSEVDLKEMVDGA